MNAVRRGITNVILPVMRMAGRAYIAGDELEDALEVARRVRANGYASSIAYWDPNGATPNEVLAAYLDAARSLGSLEDDCYLSIKAPSLKFDRGAFAQLVAECASKKIRLHFDSLGPETADETFALAGELLPVYGNLSVTVPGCWSRSMKDVEWVVDRRVGVRVVKGQWPDPHEGAIDPVKGYLKVIEALAGRATHVAVASHNPTIVESALRTLQDRGTWCELELLYGFPLQHVLSIAKRMGVNVRIYIPYGYGWLPYSFAQATRNPRILWWLVKDMMQGNHRTGIYRDNGHKS